MTLVRTDKCKFKGTWKHFILNRRIKDVNERSTENISFNLEKQWWNSMQPSRLTRIELAQPWKTASTGIDKGKSHNLKVTKTNIAVNIEVLAKTLCQSVDEDLDTSMIINQRLPRILRTRAMSCTHNTPNSSRWHWLFLAPFVSPLWFQE